jgi:glycosyltransferase involved in cell wall biosynthesis
MTPPSWIVCQIGAREHYAVARALRQRGELARLITDVWTPPGSPLGSIKKSLRERHHPGLADAPVTAANLSCVAFELRAKARGLEGWPLMMARNAWFQRMAAREIARTPAGKAPYAVFAYSYAALDILRAAKARGRRTVLGQIDPGPPEERIVSRLCEACPEQQGQWSPVPAEYWRRWREECALADRIAVNSEWSKSALIEEGVPVEKLRVVPLAYEFPSGRAEFHRDYPERFTPGRPLRVLFLGQVSLRKGAVPLMGAIRIMKNDPVEFWFVGARHIAVSDDLEDNPRVKWFGQVPRSDAARFYREADVFVFPTYSDGFGLTQLEAQAWRLPVVASRFCGDVVEDGRNGLILPELSPEAIAGRLRFCLNNPARLAAMAANAVDAQAFSVDRAGSLLAELFDPASAREAPKPGWNSRHFSPTA